jgi:hypothetical protein
MRRQRRRPLHYSAISLFDGTVLAAYPVRKPAPKVIKRDNLKIDQEGVCREFMQGGQEIIRSPEEARFRFMDVMANRLNMRRAVRELVQPELVAIREELATVRSLLERIAPPAEAPPKA